MAKIHYTCKKCGWKASIIEQWADLRPKLCLGYRCKTSFLKEPEALLVEMPTKPEEPSTLEVSKKKKNKKEEEQEVET